MKDMQNIRYLLLLVIAAAAVFVIRDIVHSLPRQKQGAESTLRMTETQPAKRTDTNSLPADTPYWQARHESGNLEEYSWWRAEGISTGTLKVIPDPTGSGRGLVLQGEITAPALPGGDSHRIYPSLLLPECYRGGYRTSFRVWADIPPASEHGWFSFATYSNRSDWKDLFGINLGFEQGEDRLILFHVPVLSKGAFTRISSIPFPKRQWVHVEVKVDNNGIMLFQDERLIAEATKEWGAEGVGLCEAHWGLYAQGNNRNGTVLNDDITVNLDTPFEKPPRMVRGRAKGK